MSYSVGSVKDLFIMPPASRVHVFFYKHNAYKHIQAQILQKLRHCLSICWASILQNFKAFIRQITKNTHNMQISPSDKHSISIFEAQKINFAKHNEAHKNLPHAYKKKRVLNWKFRDFKNNT